MFRNDQKRDASEPFRNNNVVVGYFENIEEKQEPIAIAGDDRRRHLYIVGKTGTGKTTLLKNLVFQDLQRGAGLCLIDPHGDLAESVLDYIPRHRVRDVVYFDPADSERAIGLNILETKTGQARELAASAVVSIFKHLWRDSWGPRLEWLLHCAVAALMETPGSTLVDVYRMFVDEKFRKEIAARVEDPIIKLFWTEEFARYDERFEKEITSSVINKVGRLLSSPLLRGIVGQKKSAVDFRAIMDERKIFIANLSKGKIGEDAANLLGSMLVTKLYLASLERQDVSEPNRSDFYLYVDEFQNFATDSFASILSEARKYGLNLILAHQYLDQLSESVRKAVFGNIGSLVAFRVGSLDAEALELEFRPYFLADHLRQADRYEFYHRLSLNGVERDPSFAKTYPPPALGLVGGCRDHIIRASRERYGKSRANIEENMRREFAGKGTAA